MSITSIWFSSTQNHKIIFCKRTYFHHLFINQISFNFTTNHFQLIWFAFYRRQSDIPCIHKHTESICLLCDAWIFGNKYKTTANTRECENPQKSRQRTWCTTSWWRRSSVVVVGWLANIRIQHTLTWTHIIHELCDAMRRERNEIKEL